MVVVHEPELTVREGTTRVAARVEIGGFGERSIWFEVDGEEGSFLTARGDAFAAALLPVASALAQPLEVRGAVSPRLAWGLRELVRLRRVWWPNDSAPRELVFPRLEVATGTPTAVACSFSGGVDSWFSAIRHLPRNESIPEYRVTHLTVVNGFDHDRHLDDPSWFEAMRAIYGPVAEKEGLRLFAIRTNATSLMSLGAPIDWYRWIGTLLGAPALALGGGVARYYIGASEGYGHLEVGSNPLSDPWHSTESLQLIHDGAEATRIEKLEMLAEHPETWNRLRVCRTLTWRNVDVARGAVRNCGVCGKCVRTMVALRLIGRLDRFTTFARPLTLRAVATARLNPTAPFFVRENVRRAIHHRQYFLTAALAAGLWVERYRSLRTGVAQLLRRRRRPAKPRKRHACSLRLGFRSLTRPPSSVSSQRWG